MLWGAFRHGVTEYRVHVHVVPACSPEVAAPPGFRNALRADRGLCRRSAALARLGLAGHQPRRLYQDDLDLDDADRLAS
jgi:hypothetical protein